MRLLLTRSTSSALAGCCCCCCAYRALASSWPALSAEAGLYGPHGAHRGLRRGWRRQPDDDSDEDEEEALGGSIKNRIKKERRHSAGVGEGHGACCLAARAALDFGQLAPIGELGDESASIFEHASSALTSVQVSFRGGELEPSMDLPRPSTDLPRPSS